MELENDDEPVGGPRFPASNTLRDVSLMILGAFFGGYAVFMIVTGNYCAIH